MCPSSLHTIVSIVGRAATSPVILRLTPVTSPCTCSSLLECRAASLSCVHAINLHGQLPPVMPRLYLPAPGLEQSTGLAHSSCFYVVWSLSVACTGFPCLAPSAPSPSSRLAIPIRTSTRHWTPVGLPSVPLLFSMGLRWSLVFSVLSSVASVPVSVRLPLPPSLRFLHPRLLRLRLRACVSRCPCISLSCLKPSHAPVSRQLCFVSGVPLLCVSFIRLACALYSGMVAFLLPCCPFDLSVPNIVSAHLVTLCPGWSYCSFLRSLSRGLALAAPSPAIPIHHAASV